MLITPEKKERNERVLTKARVLTSAEHIALFKEKVENKKRKRKQSKEEKKNGKRSAQRRKKRKNRINKTKNKASDQKREKRKFLRGLLSAIHLNRRIPAAQRLAMKPTNLIFVKESSQSRKRGKVNWIACDSCDGWFNTDCKEPTEAKLSASVYYCRSYRQGLFPSVLQFRLNLSFRF